MAKALCRPYLQKIEDRKNAGRDPFKELVPGHGPSADIEEFVRAMDRNGTLRVAGGFGLL